jgi:hypothetical protein
LEKLKKAKKDRKNVLAKCMIDQGFEYNCEKIKGKTRKSSKKAIRFCKGIVSKNEKIENNDKKTYEKL